MVNNTWADMCVSFLAMSTDTNWQLGKGGYWQNLTKYRN